MNESWAIGRPGQSLIGHAREVGDLERQRALPARVDEAGGGVDDQPEAAERALALDPRDEVVGQLDPLLRCARGTNSPGWMTNGSSVGDLDLLGQVRRRRRAGRSPRRGGCGRRGTSRRGAGRRSPAGPCAGSHGSIAMRPSSTRRRIVPSERTEVGGIGAKSASGRRPSALRAVVRSRAGDHRARARRRRRERRVAVRAAARAARAAAGAGARGRCGCRRRRRRAPRSVSGSAWIAHQTIQQQRDDRDLEDDHQVEKRPAHAAAHATRCGRAPRARRRRRQRLRRAARSAAARVEARHALQLGRRARRSRRPSGAATRSVPNSSTLNEASAVP